jgi:hypothetical protein
MGSKDRFGMVQMAEPPEPLSPRPLEFPRRPRIVKSDLGERRIWKSRCGRWIVLREKRWCGVTASLITTDIWLLLRRIGLEGDSWQTISRHQTKREAFEAAQQQAAETPIPIGARPC